MDEGAIKLPNLSPLVEAPVTLERDDSSNYETLCIHHAAGSQSVPVLQQGESLVEERTAALPAYTIKTIYCLS